MSAALCPIPSAREPGTSARVTNSRVVAETPASCRGQSRPPSTARAKSPTASAVPNKPAWPAAPPSAQQFSSCTSPTSRPSAPRIVFGRRDRRAQIGRRVEEERLARHLPQQLVRLRLERPSTCVFDDEAEQDESEIAVKSTGCQAGTRAEASRWRAETPSVLCGHDKRAATR